VVAVTNDSITDHSTSDGSSTQLHHSKMLQWFATQIVATQNA